MRLGLHHEQHLPVPFGVAQRRFSRFAQPVAEVHDLLAPHTLLTDSCNVNVGRVSL